MTRGRGGCAVSTEQTLFIPYRTRLVSKFLANNEFHGGLAIPYRIVSMWKLQLRCQMEANRESSSVKPQIISGDIVP